MISQDVRDHLIRKEKDIYAAYKQHEMSVIDSALASDFREIGGSGRLFSKSEVLEAMQEIQVIDYAFEEIRFLPLDESNAIVAYVVTMRRIENGKERVDRAVRSSVWTKRNSQWRITFHQATPLPSST